ncbi:uncharacterized protein FOMMEDRAFT_148251 [Fomitiporia mediterranea MF3/22]|uniref:uncharacterized protein n=1 Tax=Fomitiporia mediterranea (strain MF3/22) TaxID=694068 RepID=UPI000440945F|nr:uncharacterized protein FOMMEDRAFT_148251 [Fomitiporia mediterranea MF3/22]EJD00491.1 hypothetical protein FOMMEDRAFT_148251 [Fomitiporia mediterranea MF3/22]
MPILKNHEVWIESDQKRYEEYQTEVENDVVTCYIVSEAGKIFQIQWKNHECPLEISTRATVETDGVHMRTKTWCHEDGENCGSIRGVNQDTKTYWPYKFAHVILTDNGGVAASKDMGTIVISLFRVIVTSTSRSEKCKPRTVPIDLDMPLNKKSNKMGCHRIGLGDTVHDPNRRLRTIRTKPYGIDVSPYVTFRFIYRPKEILQALEVIPVARTEKSKRAREPLSVAGRSNTTPAQNQRKRRRMSNAKAERDVTNLSDIDQTEQELLKQRAEVDRKLKELRKSKGKASARVKLEVKVEDEISMSAAFVLDTNGAIDLTLD